MALLVDKFFCFRLESTAKFLGWLAGIISILIIVILAICLGNFDKLMKILMSENYSKEQREILENYVKFNLIFGIVASCINVVVNICLVVGTIKKLHNLLLPTLVFGFIGNVYSAISLFNPSSVGAFIGTLSGLAFNIYLLIAIYSLYKKIEAERHELHK